MTVEVAVPHICTLGEGPVWDLRTQSICWIDIIRKEIHEYLPAEKIFKTLSLNEMPGAVAICTDGNFIAALAGGFAFIDRISGDVSRFNNPEDDLPGNRFNDGKCDPAGRFWAGSMALDEETGAGSLYRLGDGFLSEVVLTDVTISNGLAWSPDGRIFYYIDTPTREVVAYDYDTVNGNISNKRTIITVPEAEGYPDGMTIDNEGMLWIAHWDGWQVSRWDPQTGAKLTSISLPAARITSCTFGGDDLRDLYITSAGIGLTPEQQAAQPLAGSLFVIPNCGYQGLAADLFYYDKYKPR